MDEIKLQVLDPGIRGVVHWLRLKGFRTCDSGDGASKANWGDEALPYPHVFIVVEPSELVSEAQRLRRLLRSRGLLVSPVGTETGITIQATFDPADGSALLAVVGLNAVHVDQLEKPVTVDAVDPQDGSTPV